MKSFYNTNMMGVTYRYDLMDRHKIKLINKKTNES